MAVRGLGAADVQDLAKAALVRASQGIPDRRIKTAIDQVVADQGECRFAGSPEKIQCGASTLSIGTMPELYFRGVQVYGKAFSGYSGQFKVSSGWSYSQGVEDMKSDSTYSKTGEEVSKYADDLVSRGQGREAVAVKKNAVSQSKSGKAGLGIQHLLPGIH